MSNKFLDMGENMPSQSMTQSNNLWDANKIREQMESLGRDSFLNQLPISSPEKSNEIGSERVIIMGPQTLDALNQHVSSPSMIGEEGLSILYGFKIQVSAMVKEGEVFLVTPTPLNVSEQFRYERIKEEVPNIFSRFENDQTVVATAHTPFMPGDIIDDLVGDEEGETRREKLLKLALKHTVKKPEIGEIKEERIRLGERRLRDGDEKK